MKRSAINRAMTEALEFCRELKFALPPFATWTLEDWQDKGHEYDEIRDNLLGWDVTDFGSGDFENIGLLLFTIRNGNHDNPKYFKPYAEKLLICNDKQVTPYHFHYKKVEDIINRGGGTLVIKCYNSSEDGNELLDTPVKIYMDGREFMAEAGEEIRIGTGESITLPTGQYHSFWGEGGKVLVGEVSVTNDDKNDNRFLSAGSRFPTVEEDEPILYPLVIEYPPAK
ncbi:MAG: D-lyxose/D-mannose family sugar isomerase [Christensenellales bacterium]|jgi:D-lyxose ketol-isomerase